MHDSRSPRAGAFNVTPWADGIAAIVAEGADRREALEAGLRAVLALSLGESMPPAANEDVRSAPIRGEGADLPALFADLVEDVLDQLADFGVLHDVALDGVLRRDREGFVGWGYVAVPARPSRPPSLPRLTGLPEVYEDDRRYVVRAALTRE